jgi:DNA-directed RNA polymerase specialized sigma24 family protein
MSSRQGKKMATNSEGSVTCWIHRLKAGDQAAVQMLWERYYRRLVGLARARLRNAPRQVADEDDVATGAIASFYRRAAGGHFPDLRDRDDLWQLLVVITRRKACNQARHALSQKEGGGKVRNLSALLNRESSAAGADFFDLISREPDPGFAALVAEECRRRLDQLEDDAARKVVQWKMEGYSNREIAVLLGRSEPTVERKLRRVRSCWEKEVTP